MYHSKLLRFNILMLSIYLPNAFVVTPSFLLSSQLIQSLESPFFDDHDFLDWSSETSFHTIFCLQEEGRTKKKHVRWICDSNLPPFTFGRKKVTVHDITTRNKVSFSALFYRVKKFIVSTFECEFHSPTLFIFSFYLCIFGGLLRSFKGPLLEPLGHFRSI